MKGEKLKWRNDFSRSHAPFCTIARAKAGEIERTTGDSSDSGCNCNTLQQTATHCITRDLGQLSFDFRDIFQELLLIIGLQHFRKLGVVLPIFSLVGLE